MATNKLGTDAVLERPEGARQNTSVFIRDNIENMILTGALLPGERLDEATLAKKFSASRTPVREALLQLNSVGLVELRPNRSAIVAKAGPEKTVQMFEVMAELEGMAARLASRRYSAEDKDKLVAAQEKCRAAERSADADAYYYENEHFHQAIYAASRNGFLAEQCLALQRRLRPYRRLQLRAHNRIQASMREHDEIVEAILGGNGTRASKLIKAHIIIQGERFEDLIAILGSHPE